MLLALFQLVRASNLMNQKMTQRSSDQHVDMTSVDVVLRF